MSTNLENSINLADWITQAQAGRIRGVSRQAIHRLVKRGKLSKLEVGGLSLVKRADVVTYKPGEPGRPKAMDDPEHTESRNA